MEFIVKGRNIDLTDDLKQMAEKKIRARVEKYCPKAVEVEVELSQEKNPKIAKNKIAPPAIIANSQTKLNWAFFRAELKKHENFPSTFFIIQPTPVYHKILY